LYVDCCSYTSDVRVKKSQESRPRIKPETKPRVETESSKNPRNFSTPESRPRLSSITIVHVHDMFACTINRTLLVVLITSKNSITFVNYS